MTNRLDMFQNIEEIMASTLKILQKLKDKKQGNLHLGRVLEDGMPFRGPHVPLREEEYDELTEVTYDSQVEVFDVMVPEQKSKLSEIIDYAINGWYVIHEKTAPQFLVSPIDGSVKILVCCTWSVPHRELNMQRAGSIGPITG
jgi:hypothetical protein